MNQSKLLLASLVSINYVQADNWFTSLSPWGKTKDKDVGILVDPSTYEEEGMFDNNGT